MKSILNILILFAFQLCYSQKAEVILPKMKEIYIGIDNPVRISVEGYQYDELLINTLGCKLIGKNPDLYIRAENLGECLVIVSYKTQDATLTDTSTYRIKAIPKPEAMFGALSTGHYPSAALLAQNAIWARIPGAVSCGYSCRVVSYSWKYVNHTTYSTCSDSVTGATITTRLKHMISKNRGSGNIIISNIRVKQPSGVIMNINDLEISFGLKKPSEVNPDLIIHKNYYDSVISYYDFEPVFGCDALPLFSRGLLKLCKTCSGDTQVLQLINISSTSLLSKRQYYLSGNLMAEYMFENNDTTGYARLYYENGNVKSEGNIIVIKENISEHYRPNGWMNPTSYFIDSFITLDFAAIGPWKGYFDNGALALDCNFALEGYKILEQELNKGSCGNHATGFYSISETRKHPENNFYPALIGPLKKYDPTGKLVLEENY